MYKHQRSFAQKRSLSPSLDPSTMMTAMQPEKKAMALVCLQAQHVAGLPVAAEGRQILLRLQQQQQETAEAASRCRAGVAAFHDQVLLLHCTPIDRITSGVVAVTVTVSFPDLHDQDDCYTAGGGIDLAAQLHRPSPSVLSFVLGGGAVLSLTLHHRLVHRRRSACLPLPTFPDLVLNCLRKRTPADDDPTGHNDKVEGDDQSSSSGFITIEKGTISRRRPPSDNLLTTDDEGDGGKPMTCCYPLAEELEAVEMEFLAKLDQLADDRRRSWDLDALIKDAEAELAELYL